MGALTLANIAIAREVAKDLGLTPRFHIIGMRDQGASYVPAAENYETFIIDGRSMVNGLWAKLGKMDCLLDIGAGDSFTEIYGWKRFAYLWATKALAIWRGVPLLLSPQTIGPFTRPPYVQLARYVMERATAVLARDTMSFDVLRSLAPRAKAVLSVDVAFALPFDDRSNLRGREPVRVGVNVSGLMFGEAASGRNKFRLDFDYRELMFRLLDDLIKRPGLEVHLVTHAVQRGEGASNDDDDTVADLLKDMFPNAIRVPTFQGPSEAKSYISGLDILVAGRMHACIGAFSARTAVVPIAYSRKFSGLFDMLKYRWVLPMNGMNTDQALAFLQDCVSRPAELAAATDEGMGMVDALLEAYRRELRELFSAARVARD